MPEWEAHFFLRLLVKPVANVDILTIYRPAPFAAVI